MCLEEMLACTIQEGALFYQRIKRRERIPLNDELRNTVKKDFLQMHDLFARAHTPQVRSTKACSACSLRNWCLPELTKTRSAQKYIDLQINGMNS